MIVLNLIDLVLLNAKRFEKWKNGLSPERIHQHLYRRWYWRSLNLITKEDYGYYHCHFVFYKFNKRGEFLYHKYYWRTNDLGAMTEKEMAEQIIRNAIVCGFWEKAYIDLNDYDRE